MSNKLVDHALLDLRTNILINLLKVFSILSVPVLVSVFIRVNSTGWNFAYVFFIVACIITPILYFVGRKIPFNLLLIFSSGIVFLAMITGIIALNVFSTYEYLMMIIIMIGAVLYGNRALTLIMLFIMTAIILFTGFGYTYGFFEVRFDTNEYLRSPIFWIAEACFFTLFAYLMTASMGGFHNRMTEFLYQAQDSVEEVNAMKDQMESIIEFSPVPLFVTRLDGEIIKVNRSFTETFGYEREEVQSIKHLFKCFFRNDKEVKEAHILWKDEIERYKNGKEGSKGYRMHVFAKNGKPKTINFSIKVVEDKVISTLEDQTALLNYQDELLETEKKLISKNNELIQKNERVNKLNRELTKANNELDNFVYRVSHDLRAPLSTAIGLIKISQIEDSRDKIIGFLNMQQNSLMKLESFIQEILDFTRSTRSRVEPKKVDLGALIEEIASQTKPPEEDITFACYFDQKSEIVTDKTRVHIILNNIISNAFKYRDLHKEEHKVQIDVKSDDKQFQIQVRDNGIGIASEYQSRVFDMFYRATDTRQGTGLGLYIVKECVEKLEGEVQMVSEYGKGTEIKITLPNMQQSDKKEELLISN